MAKSVGPGVREKLRRADLHRKDFERRVQRFFYSKAYTYFREDDFEAGKSRWIVKIHRKPPLVRWGALIGECLFNYRSALDHLAFDLAVAYSGYPFPKGAEEKSEFPIFWKRSPKPSELNDKIGCVDPKARREILQMQPHGRKDRAALKYLDSLHNFDKHRTLHLVVGQATGVAVFAEIDPDWINFGPLKNGDVLAQVSIEKDPELQYQPQFTFGVAFSETGPGAKAPDVAWTLRWIDMHIRQSVIPPLLPFLY